MAANIQDKAVQAVTEFRTKIARNGGRNPAELLVANRIYAAVHAYPELEDARKAIGGGYEGTVADWIRGMKDAQ